MLKNAIIVMCITAIMLICTGCANKENKNDEKIEENVTQQSNINGEDIANTKLNYDEFKNEPNDSEEGEFLLAIEDVFNITGTGTVVTGRVARGSVKVGDSVQIIGIGNEVLTTTVTKIEKYKKDLDEATKGDDIGIVLENINRTDVERGKVIIKPDTMKVYKKFEATMYTITEEEGGEKTGIQDNGSMQFYFRTTDLTGTINLLNEEENTNPGEQCGVSIELNKECAMEVGSKFTVRKGGKTIAIGKVTKVIE